MHHVKIMERLKTGQALDQVRPQLVLREASAFLKVALDFAKHIATFSELHH